MISKNISCDITTPSCSIIRVLKSRKTHQITNKYQHVPQSIIMQWWDTGIIWRQLYNYNPRSEICLFWISWFLFVWRLSDVPQVSEIGTGFCYSVLDIHSRISIGCDLTAEVYEVVVIFYSVVVCCDFAIFLWIILHSPCFVNIKSNLSAVFD